MVWYFKALPRPDAPTPSMQTGLKMFLIQYTIGLNHLKPLFLNILHYKEESMSKYSNILPFFTKIINIHEYAN